MYAKIFEQIFDSSIAEDWQIRHVFEDLLKLCDRDGVIDRTPEAIARRTNVPLEVVTRALAALERPDPSSRNPGNKGRRIVRLDPHRSWGWRIVNYHHYRQIASDDQRRTKNLDAVHRYRDKSGARAAMSADPLNGIENVQNENSPVAALCERRGETVASAEAPQPPEARTAMPASPDRSAPVPGAATSELREPCSLQGIVIPTTHTDPLRQATCADGARTAMSASSSDVKSRVPTNLSSPVTHLHPPSSPVITRHPPSSDVITRHHLSRLSCHAEAEAEAKADAKLSRPLSVRELPIGQKPSPDPTKTTKPNKLNGPQRELADRIEAALGDQWLNDAGKWITRLKMQFAKTDRVIAEVENARKESRIATTPAQYAEDTWRRFAG